jgi:monoamine oxidase
MNASAPLSRHGVVIVGAGLAGLALAHRLEQRGVTDLVILEARDRVGGRVERLDRGSRPHLEAGGETIVGHAPYVLGLARELGVAHLPEPSVSDAARDVRIARDGRRYEEAAPLAGDRPAADAFETAVRALDALAEAVDPAAPWAAGRARELDAQTLAGWLAENVAHPEARTALATLFAENGGHADEVSLLSTLWSVSSHGGMAAYLAPHAVRLRGGPSELVRRLAATVRAPVTLCSPVRRVAQHADGCTVVTDGGQVHADAVVLALSPTLAAGVEFVPPLPAARDRLQQRWLQGHGAKAFAIYPDRFWIRDGLSGSVSAPHPFPFVADHSLADGGEGILLGLVMSGSDTFRGPTDLLDSDDVLAERFVEHLVRCFGPAAAAPTDVHVRRWFGDRWSHGAGTGTPPGTLSSVGRAIRARVGRIVWAGAETGVVDHLEGAAGSAARAAEEVIGLLEARP